MKTIIHKATTRGRADHGWLKSYHTFSFSGYFNEDRNNFGALRVLNDDFVAAGQGFGMHSHDNMEIISIPLEGILQHEDSMGNKGTIVENEIQVMSAGSGIRHSEYNASSASPVKFLQIWLFPNKRNVIPRYDQIKLDPVARHNKFQQIISPNPDDAGTWIHQDAWFSLADLDENTVSEYVLNNVENGVYIFILDGELEIANEVLTRRDAIGLTKTEVISIQARTKSSILVMEVPMKGF